jgi:tRNA pseudouridine38-40 synthase
VHQAEETRYRATVHYDGSGFSGWQVQPVVRTVQGELEGCLRKLGLGARLAAAGRTDAGVHATGQEIRFDSARQWDEEELTRALRAVTPEDVWVQTVREAEADFHPRFSATGRRYEYYLASGSRERSPLRRRSVWWLPREPDVERMMHVSRQLPGTKDFRSLAKSGQPELGTRCTVETAEWMRTALGDLRFTIVADRFLHRMVRYLVAVLVEIGTERRNERELAGLLRSEATVRAPKPAPPGGLYLTGVRYPEGWNQVPGVAGLVPPHRRAPAGI